MKRNKPVSYIIRRKFLCELSPEELLIRIVKAHLDESIPAKRAVRK